MAKLKDKVFVVYNEGNILRLGAPLLLGIQLQETLDVGFNDLPALTQRLHAAATVMLLLGLGLLLAPLAYNRMVEEGLPTEELHALASRVMDLAVMPFVLGLGVNFNIVVTRSSSQSAGAVAGLAVVAIGFLSLYGWRVVGWANHRQIGAFKEFNDQSPDSA
jgi:uncharacterized protein YjeT (DUF2065 family)